MKLDSVRLAYVRFRRIPIGHVFLVFRTGGGEEITVSPEALVEEGQRFSLSKGLRRSYLLKYVVAPYASVVTTYAREGRRLYEFPLDITNKQLHQLYEDVSRRGDALKQQREWYHTVTNSCITNVLDHLRSVRELDSTWHDLPTLALAPSRSRVL